MEATRESFADTQFKARWEKYARERGLPAAHDAAVGFTIEQLRRDAGEFFSWGCVHQVATQKRLRDLFPDDATLPAPRSKLSPRRAS